MNKILLFQPPDTHDCSYLADRQSRSLYVDPRLELNSEQLTLLSLNGFRRSGRLVYRPDCPGCSACIPVRLRAADLVLSRNQQRVLKRNRDLTLEVASPGLSEEVYSLYERYITGRHGDGDMYPPGEKQFEDFLASDFGTTRYLLARHKGRLIGCMVFDVLDDGLSAVYCFYDPDEQSRSIGTLMILRLTQLCAGLHLPFNYLGYFVWGSRKMEYKRQFFPLEQLSDGRWQLLSP